MTTASKPLVPRTAEVPAVLGLAFLAMYGALVVVAWTGLVLRVGGVSGWMALASIAITGAVVFAVVPRADRTRLVAVALVAVVAILAVSAVVAPRFYDGSFDGRAYHTDGIIALAEGWNPFENPQPPSRFTYGATVRNYPKASWLAASTLYKLTGSIEAGKAINVLPLGASFLLVLGLLLRLGVRSTVAWVGSTLAAVNPIWVVQSLSNYVDGQTASLLLAAIAAGLWILLVEQARVVSWSLGLCVLLLVNLKFTGIYYVGLILAVTTIVLLWQLRWIDVRKFLVTQGVVLLLTIGLIGFNPYVQNLLDFGSPMYPVYGPGATDILTGNTPENLRDVSHFVRLAYGVFGQPGNPIDAPAVLTWPFSIADLAITTPYQGSDTRIAGLGPWFGGALLLSVVSGAWLLWRERRRWRGKPLLVGSLVGFLVVSWLLHPQGWWARYTPQLWLVPVTVAVGLWAGRDRLARGLGASLALILAFNVGFVTTVYTSGQRAYTHQIKRFYTGFESSVSPIPVYIHWFPSATRVKFREADVAFIEYSSPADLPCDSPEPLPEEIGLYCPTASGS